MSDPPTELVPVTVDAVLMPLDRKRCMAVQADLAGYVLNRRTVNGAVPLKRCANAAMYIAAEKVSNETGYLHQMTVCGNCRRGMERQRSGQLNYSPL